MNKIKAALFKFRDSKFGWAVLVSIVGFLILVVASLVSALIIMSLSLLLSLGEGTQEIILMLLFPIALITCSVFASWALGQGKAKPGIKRILGLRLPNKKVWWILPAVIGSYILILMLVMMVLYAISPEASQQSQEVGQVVSRLWGWQLAVTIISVAVLTPIAEEVFFRGLMLWTYSEKLSLIFSIGLTSLFFAIAHMQLNVGLDTFFLAIGLSLLRWQTESIYPAIFVHMLKNSLAVVFLLAH